MASREEFAGRLRRALASPNLSTALERSLGSFRDRRAAAFAGRDFPAIQRDLAALKRQAIDRLPELVAQFADAAEQAGAVVHMARDAAEACQIVGALARERGVTLAVKSKSMATEEIGLNDFLERQGMTVVETDLGEWIIQLAGEHPSHLIAPAIHKTKEEVADLFTRTFGEPAPADIPVLVEIARRRLRQSFIDAGMGISGANIGIAETGTLVIVSNEGNVRLTTTLPPLHVAVMGIEKIVPSMEDATAILQALPRSATGQLLSSYVSFITGPSRTADIELSLTIGVHGPKEVHIVLLDNGRWAMRDDPDFREALDCIRCAACSNVCPSYQVVGGHAFGHIYTGPIGLILTAFHHGLEAAAGPQSLCASCNACETVCPAGIPLPQMIMDVRQRWVGEHGLSWPKRTALETLADPSSFRRWMRVARLVQVPFRRGDGQIRPPFAPSFRSLPAVADVPLRDRMTARPVRDQLRTVLPAEPAPGIPHNGATGLTIAYFAGCLTDWLYPEMGEAVVHVLESLGARVAFPAEQWCCGLPAANAGDQATAIRMAKQTIATLEAASGDYIVAHSTSCVAAMVQDYRHLLHSEPEWQERARALSERILDFSTFLDRVARLPQGALAGRLPGRVVTYHDACQSHNALGRSAEQRRILRDVLGLELSEMRDAAVCCGFGGSFSAEHPQVSAAILERKLKNVEATGATIVVTDNPGCILQLRGGTDVRNSRTRVVHLAELVSEAMGRNPRTE